MSFLKAADLTALPQVFYGGANPLNLGLGTKEGAKHIPNPAADMAKEVRDYLVSQHEYGNREACQGKALERRSMARPMDGSATCSGWSWRCFSGRVSRCPSADRNSTRLPIREAGALHEQHEVQIRVLYPDQAVDLKTLTQAVQCYEGLTGETVDVEKNAIGVAAKAYAEMEMKQVIPMIAEVKARSLPGLTNVEAYREARRISRTAPLTIA